MFGQPSGQGWRRQSRLTSASMALHGLLLGWLLHTPPPQLLTLRSVALGRNGMVSTRIYWPVETPDDSHTSSAHSATEVYRHQRLTNDKLIWKQTARTAKLNAPQLPLSRSETPNPSTTETLSRLGHGAPAGLPYGALSNGRRSGMKSVRRYLRRRRIRSRSLGNCRPPRETSWLKLRSMSAERL